MVPHTATAPSRPRSGAGGCPLPVPVKKKSGVRTDGVQGRGEARPCTPSAEGPTLDRRDAEERVPTSACPFGDAVVGEGQAGGVRSSATAVSL